MNDYPTSPAPSAPPPVQRNRRSGRVQGRHAKAKQPGLITWWQALILIALVGVIVYQAAQLNRATVRLDALYQARQEEQERYEEPYRATSPSTGT